MSTPRTASTARFAAFALSLVMTLATLASVGALAEPPSSGIYLVDSGVPAARG